MGVQAINNANLIDMCRNCGAAGFVPIVTYTYNAGSGALVVTNSSTIPAGDTLKKLHLRLTDEFGGEVRGHIDGLAGGDGYITPPAVVFSGGGGTGAAGTAVISNGRVTGVTITAPGSDYSSDPTIAFTGGGGTGAAGTVNRSTTTVASVTMTADDGAATLSASTLNKSKPLNLLVTVLTTGGISADGGAYWLQAAGDVASWDVKKNAI